VLSTFGAHNGQGATGREQELLYGPLGDALGPVSAWISLRPAHLDIRSDGFCSTRDFNMNAELTASAGTFRLNLGSTLLPRTHWNVVVSYYDDRARQTDRSTKTFLAVLHLYL
jgi:hypothetical protein